MRQILCRSVRAVFLDEDDRLVLIKRIKPDQAPYWTTPGGGLESTDVSPEAALRRELRESDVLLMAAVKGPQPYPRAAQPEQAVQPGRPGGS